MNDTAQFDRGDFEDGALHSPMDQCSHPQQARGWKIDLEIVPRGGTRLQAS